MNRPTGATNGGNASTPRYSFTWPELEEGVELVVAFYNRAKEMGWRTPEMDQAREFLRKWAPGEVWA